MKAWEEKGAFSKPNLQRREVAQWVLVGGSVPVATTAAMCSSPCA